MTKTKSLKRAMLMSLLALVVCLSMFVGSTFAWFTDSVTSVGNIIKSGKLDVTMEWADGKTDPTNTTWTDASTGAIFNSELWEPGYVEVRHIKIANAGTLALKYQLNILANGAVSELADVIDVYYVDPAVKVENRDALANVEKIGTLSEVLAQVSTTAAGELEAGENHTITLALKMQETAGNEYQDKSIGSDFSVQLLATQLTYEGDSFDNQYDANAPFSMWNGTVPSEKPETLVVDPTSRTITVNDADAFAYLNTLLANWVSTYSNGQGTEYSNYRVENGGQGVDYYYTWGWDVKLNCDIDLGYNAWTPVNLSKFRAIDGQGHTVKNISVTATTNEVGLFAIVPGGVSNLTVENVNINASAYNSVGAVGGTIHGKINNVKVKNAFVTGNKYVGGIVGYGYAYVINSTVSDSVITIPSSGAKEAGGLAGYLAQSSTDKVAITGNTVKNTIISAPSIASALVSQPQANFDITYNTVENVTITTVDDTADIFVSNNVGGTSIVSDNKEIGSTVNKLATIPNVAQDTATLKNAANVSNATVLVAPGKYTTVTLKEGVTLIGSEGTVIEQAEGSNAALGSTKNTTIKNVEFVGTNAQRWGYAGGNVVFENCTFKGEGTGNLSWAIHYDGLGGANLTYKNCTIIGWVAIGSGASSLVFDGCNFYGNGEFGLCRAYSDFTVKNCTFDYSNVDHNGTRSIGIEALSGATVSIENCTNVNGNIEDIISTKYVGTQYEGNVILNGVPYVPAP